jgi:hypothetical protein
MFSFQRRETKIKVIILSHQKSNDYEIGEADTSSSKYQ